MKWFALMLVLLNVFVLAGCDLSPGSIENKPNPHLYPWEGADLPYAELLLEKREEGINLSRYLAYAPHALGEMGVEYMVGSKTTFPTYHYGNERKTIGDEHFINEMRTFKYPMHCIRFGKHYFLSSPPENIKGHPIDPHLYKEDAGFKGFLEINMFGQMERYAEVGGRHKNAGDRYPSHPGGRTLQFRYTYAYTGESIALEEATFEKASDRLDPDKWVLLKAELGGASSGSVSSVGCLDLEDANNMTVYSERYVKASMRLDQNSRALVAEGVFNRNYRDLSVPWEAVKPVNGRKKSHRNGNRYYRAVTDFSGSGTVEVVKVLGGDEVRVKVPEGSSSTLKPFVTEVAKMFRMDEKGNVKLDRFVHYTGAGRSMPKSVDVKLSNVKLIPGKEPEAKALLQDRFMGKKLRLACAYQLEDGQPLCTLDKGRFKGERKVDGWMSTALISEGLAWLDYSRGVEPYERYDLEDVYLDAIDNGRFGPSMDIVRY